MPTPPPRLNPDTVWEIADYLSTEDLARCCQVSKAWRDLWAESLWNQYEWERRKRPRIPVEVLRR
ncbi:hypothetical protein BG015_011571, partial [Linnemannia schmuckeri]